MCTLHAQRKQEVALGYQYADPMGSMAYNIEHANGITLNYGVLTLEDRLAVGLDINYAWYGRDKSRQEYEMEDGSTAPMDIIVSNTFGHLAVYGRWYLSAEKTLRPFLSARAGYMWFNTDLNIYDPDDLDHCEPIDTDVLARDRTFAGAIGGGVKADLSGLFEQLPPNKFHFEAAINLTQGGRVSYMNVNGPMPHHGSPHADYVSADFLNTETMVVHRHHVGYLYNSHVQMTEVKLGFSLQLHR